MAKKELFSWTISEAFIADAKAAWGRLPAGLRRVAVLAVTGSSKFEIAEQCGVTENTIRSQYRIILGKLRCNSSDLALVVLAGSGLLKSGELR